MDIGSLLLVLALAIFVILFISRPFFEQKNIPDNTIIDEENHHSSELLAERDQVLDALNELDFDHAIGKIPVEDYSHQRKLLVDRGVKIMRELDELKVEMGEDDIDTDKDVELEAAISARQAEVSASPDVSQSQVREAYPAAVNSAVADPNDELEYMIANRRRAKNDETAGFCPNCGGPIHRSDRFCPKCGKTIG